MIQTILGIIFLLLGIWGLIFVIMYRKNMPISLFGVSEDKYEVINKDKINTIMIIECLTISIYIILVSLIIISTAKFYLLGMVPLIGLFYRFIAKRYVKML